MTENDRLAHLAGYAAITAVLASATWAGLVGSLVGALFALGVVVLLVNHGVDHGRQVLRREARRAADDVAVTDGGGRLGRFELYQDSADEWRWRLVHPNGNVIADGGEGYASKQKAQQGIESVKTHARPAPVVEVDG